MARAVTGSGPAARVLAPMEGRHSFPSSTALYATLVVAAFWPILKELAQPVLIASLPWAGWGSVALRALPADVLDGWLVELLCFAVATALMGRKRTWTTSEKTS